MGRAKSLFILALTSVAISCNSNPISSKEEGVEEKIPETADTVAKQETTAKETIIRETKVLTTDTAAFHKKLEYKNTTFDVTATGKGSLQHVTIQPHGLTHNQPITLNKIDPVVNAQVADLNGDGFAELLIYTQSAGSGSYGKVYGYSVNAGKSVSAITFSPVSSNPQVNSGYRGHDQFEIINNKFTQRFPIYNQGDANSQPTGRQRIITYKLVNGEAARAFEVDKVTEQ